MAITPGMILLPAGTTVNWPWQLSAVNASTAYALGYYGQGVTLGMMDSGYRPTHEAFQTSLIESVHSSGVYATSGFSYRTPTPGKPFHRGHVFRCGRRSGENK
jgi:subtilase-type serine protease